MNSLHFKGQKNSIKNVLLLYDKSVRKNTDIPQLREALGRLNLEIEEKEIPVINEFMVENINYQPLDGDCILVPSLQLHLATILDLIGKELESIIGISSAYICFTKPEGNLVQWIRVAKTEDSTLNIEVINHTLPYKSPIEWYFESGISYDVPELNLANYKLEKIIESEEKATNLGNWIEKEDLIEITDIKSKDEIGFGFEKLAACCINKSKSIHQTVMNVHFSSERRNIQSKREEDVIAIHKNGNLLYVSCKFKWCKNSVNCKNEILLEMDRIRNLQLPFKIPKQRITRMLVTTSKASELVSSDGEVIVTNLAGLSQIIESL